MVAPIDMMAHFAAVSDQSSDRVPTTRPPVPWFVLGFLLMIGVNSLGVVPASIKSTASIATTSLLACGLAAMGLETSVVKLKAKGARPLLLGASAWLFISGFSLAMIGLVE